MKTRTLFFVEPYKAEIREGSLRAPAENEVLVETICSAISAGTEMLVYHGRFPRGIEIDSVITPFRGSFEYPLAYGYACVGVIKETGRKVDKSWRDKMVFAFQPHTSHFVATPDSLLPIPEGFTPETACFLPNMETAVNLVQDAAPILGEQALAFGQGIVGLLTAALLMEFPLASLITCDCYPLRREASLSLGVSASLDPNASDFREQVRKNLPSGADLSLELSGAPTALNDAIALTGFGGRVVIGSWYGQKKAELDLGGDFHRSRIKLIASQVSTISSELSARWDKTRRFKVTWDALERIQPQKWITHRFPMGQADKAYDMLDKQPEEAIQILFVYQ